MTSNVALNELHDCLQLIERARGQLTYIYSATPASSPTLKDLQLLAKSIDAARAHLETARALLTQQVTT